MDSPKQLAYGVPVTSIEFQNPELTLEMTPQQIHYSGRLQKNSDTITGTFTQNGKSIPLTLARTAASASPAPRDTQKPKKPYPYLSEDVHFQNPQAHITLAGTLTLPRQGGPFPAVVLITGSGPQDRNETLLGHQPFLVISDYLTRRGIAVLRYDDRGTAQSGGNFSTATTADFATDVQAAVAYLSTRKQINPSQIGLVGHSEGGLIAPMVASQDTRIAFIILLAGPGLPGKQVLLTQEAAISKASGVDSQRIALTQRHNREMFTLVSDISDTTALKDSLISVLNTWYPPEMDQSRRQELTKRLIVQMTSPWMRYFIRTDPSIYLKKVRCPVLALDGSHDLQILPEQNISAIKKALASGGNKRVTTHIFPGLNHLFQESKTGLPIEYASIPQSFAPVALKTITDWILAQLK